jgi:NAD(P)-dependent dehydrogenase (short-subunit alcohol dehydrogenase family)
MFDRMISADAPPRQPLAGRVALVTGGCRGLGAAIVAALAAAGARGLVLDLAPGDAAGPPAGWIVREGDVAAPGAVESAVAAAVEELGGLDVAVANAGVVPPWRGADSIDPGEWDAALAVNARGVAATIAAAAGAMSAPGGSIVAMASLNAWRAHPRQVLYTATKHAVAGIVKASAADLGRRGIRVNAVAPGPIATEALLARMASRERAGGASVSEALDRAAAETALGRLASAEEVAAAVLFLAGEASLGITGQVLRVDAGVP